MTVGGIQRGIKPVQSGRSLALQSQFLESIFPPQEKGIEVPFKPKVTALCGLPGEQSCCWHRDQHVLQSRSDARVHQGKHSG
ncbi:hypothetical protein KUCAC02_034606, partial [Chaenocephalus aceratus]